MGKRPQGPTQSISNFMLDARGAPQSKETEKAEAEARDDEDAEVAALMRETRIWRLANSAQWVAWGIVQAKVGGMPDFSPQTSGTITPTANDASERKVDGAVTDGEAAVSAHNAIVSPGAGTDPLDQEAQGLREDVLAKRPDEREEGDEAEAEDSEFDYLAYARSRAMFFWGDALELGIVEEKDLPEDVLRNVCRVEY